MIRRVHIIWIVLLLFSLGCEKYADYLNTKTNEMNLFHENADGEDGTLMVHYSSAKTSSRVIIITHHTYNQEYPKHTIANHKAYAAKHGYDYHDRRGIFTNSFRDSEANSPIFYWGLYWQKIQAIIDALNHTNRYDYVLWVDPDAIFSNFETSIENIYDRYNASKSSGHKNSILLTPDLFRHHGRSHINAGVMLIKNDSFARAFFETVTQLFPLYKDNKTPEQSAMADLAFGRWSLSAGTFPVQSLNEASDYSCDELIDGVALVPQRTLNSIYRNPDILLNEAVWCPGDFIAHFAAHPNKGQKIPELLKCLLQSKQPSSSDCHFDSQSKNICKATSFSLQEKNNDLWQCTN